MLIPEADPAPETTAEATPSGPRHEPPPAPDASTIVGTTWQGKTVDIPEYTPTIKFLADGRLLWEVRTEWSGRVEKRVKGTWRQQGDLVYLDVPATPFGRKVTAVIDHGGDPIKGRFKTYSSAASWSEATMDLYLVK